MSYKKYRKQYVFYGDHLFEEEWSKFREILDRDGTNASAVLRSWIRDFNRRKAPGNPQRTITAFIQGHQDFMEILKREVLEECLKQAHKRSNEIEFSKIMGLLRERNCPNVDIGNWIAGELFRLGIRIWR